MSVTTLGQNNVYATSIKLETRDQEGECRYFQPGNDYQPLTINVVAGIEISTDKEVTNLGVLVTDITTERCLPYQDYVHSHAQLVYTVVYNFNGTDVSLINTPYLNDVSNTMEMVSKVCDTVLKQCTLVLRTVQCERIYETKVADGWIFDRNDQYMLYDLSVVEVGNPLSPSGITHIVDFIDTTTELVTFPFVDCETPYYIVFKDVSDSFYFELAATNLPAPDFTAANAVHNLVDEMIIRLRITDAAAPISLDLQIQTITVVLTDASDDSAITTVRFRITDKVALMPFNSNGYYSDAHFCRSYDSATQQCEAFYHATSTHTNPLVVSTLLARTPEICQTGDDDTKTDFFTFTLSDWVKLLTNPRLKATVTVTAVLQTCLSYGPARRMLQGSPNVVDDVIRSNEAVRIDFVQHSTSFILNNQATITEAPTITASTLTDMEIVYITLTVLCFSLIIVFICRRRGSND